MDSISNDHILISAFVIVLNEEKKIRRCLSSLHWVDEIVIVDGGSTDNTVALCKEFTDRVLFRPFDDFSSQKNYALSQVSGEWAFSIDADEEVSEALKNEILSVVKTPGGKVGFRIPRTSFIFKRRFRFTGTQDDRPMRLFRKESAKFIQPIHEIVLIDGNTGALEAALNHYTYDNLNEYLRRFNNYTSREAQFFHQRKRHVTFFDLWLRPFAVFLWMYIWKQGFRDGFEGFLFCCLSSCYVLSKFAKLRELKMESKQNSPT